MVDLRDWWPCGLPAALDIVVGGVGSGSLARGRCGHANRVGRDGVILDETEVCCTLGIDSTLLGIWTTVLYCMGRGFTWRGGWVTMVEMSWLPVGTAGRIMIC